MSTFVLVHGSMHGGWCWKRVAPLLRAAGHDVYTPTLTGLAERVHLAHPGIDLDAQIRDVLGVLEFEDLHDVVLAGHSYGAMVITGVADRAPERIGHLVYLDGAMARDGQTVLDLFPPEWRAPGERRWMPKATAGNCRRQRTSQAGASVTRTRAGCARSWRHSHSQPSPSRCG